MQLIFERGDRDAPVGHALIYFRGDDDSILATYVSVPPIAFDLSSYMPPFLQGALQGMDLQNAMVATPMPPIPQDVSGIDYLRALADRRHDDLVFAGGALHSDPMRLAAEAAEAAREYGELYSDSGVPAPEGEPSAPAGDPDRARFADMTEEERLRELTSLTGRLRESLGQHGADEDVLRQMRGLAETLPAKYRADRLVAAAGTPGESGQRLAELYLERSYKLFREDYLDLERIDREIDALQT